MRAELRSLRVVSAVGGLLGAVGAAVLLAATAAHADHFVRTGPVRARVCAGLASDERCRTVDVVAMRSGSDGAVRPVGLERVPESAVEAHTGGRCRLTIDPRLRQREAVPVRREGRAYHRPAPSGLFVKAQGGALEEIGVPLHVAFACDRREGPLPPPTGAVFDATVLVDWLATWSAIAEQCASRADAATVWRASAREIEDWLEQASAKAGAHLERGYRSAKRRAARDVASRRPCSAYERRELEGLLAAVRATSPSDFAERF